MEPWLWKCYRILRRYLSSLSVQFSCSFMSDSLRPHESQHARPPCPSPTPRIYPNSCPLGLGMPSNHLILCHPLLLLPSIFPSIRVFSNESALRIRWPKYWSSSFNISPSNEHPELISFRMDWLDVLAVQGTLKSLLQHHSSKASILWRSGFFTVQLSCPYMTTGKTIALTTRAFVDKVMSLLFNMAIFLNRAHIIKKDTWGILTLQGGDNLLFVLPRTRVCSVTVKTECLSSSTFTSIQEEIKRCTNIS